MIVKREFVRLGKLFETDKEAETVFMKAAKEAYNDEHRNMKRSEYNCIPWSNAVEESR